MNDYIDTPKPVNAASHEDVRAAIYAQISPASQEFGYSLDEQVDNCIERCQSLNWNIAYIFRDDVEREASGKQPMFEKMKKKARIGRFDVIVFWKLDRLSRSILDAVQLEGELHNKEIGLHSATERIDTTSADGQERFQNIEGVSELESNMNSNRAQIGMKGLALDGRWPNGSEPIGYRQADDGTLKIDEAESALVQKIFDRYTEVESMSEVERELNQRGFTTKDNNQWTATSISYILSNEIYKGDYEVSGVTEHYEEYRIVSDKLFELAKEIRDRFASDGRSERKKMPKERKKRIIRGIENEYHAFVDAKYSG